MKYFSMFTGIGGFELGINNAWRNSLASQEEIERDPKGNKSISEDTQGQQNNIPDNGILEDSKNSSGTLLQNRQEQSNSKSEDMAKIEETAELSKDIRQKGIGMGRIRTEISNDEKAILNRGNISESYWGERPVCVGYSEIDKYAIATYEKHFGGHKNYGNAKEIIPEELPDFDLLCGGFPCQSFSLAGKRKGFQDTRGTLFHEICKIVAVKKPRLLFLENVKGLLSADDGRCFATILTSLDELGYSCEWQVLNSKNFGVPQNRERVFIIGHLRGKSSGQIFPIGQSSQETNQRQQGISFPTVFASQHKIARGMPMIKVHNMMPRSGNPKQGGTGHLTKEDGSVYCLDSGNTNALEMGKEIRRLTPLECERLQGFPDNWTIGSDTQRYKQCGNAVTVNVIEAIASKIMASFT